MVVIAYDISDEKRLRKVAKFLEENGIRAQRSIFELEMSLAKAKKLLSEIEKLIDSSIDKCYLYQIKTKEDLQGETSIERIL
jgi:CRISPR-associated protein Cas2